MHFKSAVLMFAAATAVAPLSAQTWQTTSRPFQLGNNHRQATRQRQQLLRQKMRKPGYQFFHRMPEVAGHERAGAKQQIAGRRPARATRVEPWAAGR